MIFILDNYDSFTYNLVQAVESLGVTVAVVRNDRITGVEILALKPDGVILSPGPGRPEEAGNMPRIFSELVGCVPILGVCLGHQMIAQHFGGRIDEARVLIHGKANRVYHDGRGVFRGLKSPMECGRYHSLAVDEESLPSCLTITARTADGEIMGLRRRCDAIEGVQFHPESILTPDGKRLLQNFVYLAKGLMHEQVSE